MRLSYFIFTTLLILSAKSSGLILVYRFNWLQSLWPLKKATCSICIPLNKALVQKQARRSWNLKLSIPAFLQAIVKCFLNLLGIIFQTNWPNLYLFRISKTLFGAGIVRSSPFLVSKNVICFFSKFICSLLSLSISPCLAPVE